MASHKGGTGRTTVALGLACAWGQAGLRVLLVDPDPTGSACLLAADAAGVCRWLNVDLATAVPTDPDADIVVIDCPSLTETAGLDALAASDGVVMTCLADVLTLRTLSTATVALREARRANGRLRLLGLAITQYNEADDLQVRLCEQVRAAGRPPVLATPIPLRPEVRDWPLRPGSGFPSGPARAAILELAHELRVEMARAQREPVALAGRD